jgi:heat shock protein HslJ
MKRALVALRCPGAWGVALFAAAVATSTAAHAEADGPDFLRVTGVAEGSVLNVRSGPGLGHPAIGSLPFDADGIRNLGCEGGPTFAQWQAASPEERAAARNRRWCRIEHGETVGWAAGWHLAEGNAPGTAADVSVASEPPDLLVGKRWSLVFAPTGAAVGEAWIEFATNGAVHGKLGCNTFRGSAEVAGEEIRTSPLATTKMFCPEPGVDQQERAMVAVLSAPVRWQLVDGQLALVSADRTQELLFISD